MNKLILSLATLGVVQGAMAAEPPRVFAHYMTCFFATPEYYSREIQLARRYGIDGFALNCGEWKKLLPNGKIEDTGYVQSADRIYQAAKEQGDDFKIFFSPDFSGVMIRNLTDLNLGDMVERYYDHPNQFRYDGKYFLSGYSGTVNQYDSPMRKLRAAGREITLVPAASSGLPYPMTWSFEQVLRLLPEGGPLDGVFRFTCDGSVADLMDVNATARQAVKFREKIYMAGVCPAYNSANLRDFDGMRGYCAMWEALIRDRPELVEIVTWNDYNEDSNLMPYRWRAGGRTTPAEKGFFNRDESFLDVTAFYSEWYRKHVRPEITQDKVYFAYRSRSRDLTKVWNEQEKKWDDIRFIKPVHDQMHDDVRDQVYVTAFLTEPAELEITQGDRTEKFSLGKGIAFAETAMRPGFTPQFRLIRKKDVLIDVAGRREILTEEKLTPENSFQARHRVNRVWMSGAAAGKAAQSFALDDRVMKPGSEPIVLETKALGDRTYNFRLTYRNSSATEARVTLYADGAPGANGEFPYYFTLTLPPTGKDFRTISFFWSTWDANTRFTIRADHSDDPKLADADFNDFGEVTLRKLELIPVQIAKAEAAPQPLHPEMVAIPGGEFTMGVDGGAPDERPARSVKVAPFALGKYEVTNEEFERFLPEHAKLRDGFSWRDREPVIYVSWTQAARYCNFLSRENGLTPVYDEKTWEPVEGADGFRLPTEAEWEYAATGRGENRIYPWGNEPPTSDRGNFQLEKSLSLSPGCDASIGGGVRVVGDYPAGASRDGAMDMAGNVTEWCSDVYRDYPREGASPDATPPIYRVLRGGSWGYYNYSQRNRDREFNSPGYGGYIYIGFRVALGEEGFQKLRK